MKTNKHKVNEVIFIIKKSKNKEKENKESSFVLSVSIKHGHVLKMQYSWGPLIELIQT